MRKDDDFIDQDFMEESKTYSPVAITIIASIIIIAVLGVGYLYKNYKHNNVEEIIIIEADIDETKSQPLDPGGMVVSNLDKDVYDTIDKVSSRKNLESTETLLPPSEEPIDKKTLAVAQDSAIEETKVKENFKEVVENTEEYIKPIVQDKIRKKSKFAGKTENFYKVQIASFKSKKDAQKEWSILSKRYPKMIGKHKHYIVSKNIEGKGIFQRLQVGPFSNEQTARRACSEFKAAGVNCFIIKP